METVRLLEEDRADLEAIIIDLDPFDLIEPERLVQAIRSNQHVTSFTFGFTARPTQQWGE